MSAAGKKKSALRPAAKKTAGIHVDENIFKNKWLRSIHERFMARAMPAVRQIISNELDLFLIALAGALAAEFGCGARGAAGKKRGRKNPAARPTAPNKEKTDEQQS